jgi:hypothetical protein
VATDPRSRQGKVILNLRTQKCLGVAGSSTASGTAVEQFTYRRTDDTRKWNIS